MRRRLVTLQQIALFASLLAIGLTGAVLLYAASTDLIRFEIANWNSIVIALCYPIAALGTGVALPELASHLAAGAAILLVGFFLFWRGYLGGGDVKLLAAMAIWIGWSALPAFLFWVAIYGGVLALVIVIIRRIPPSTALASMRGIERLRQSPAKVPYAVAISVGAIHILIQQPIITTNLENLMELARAIPD